MMDNDEPKVEKSFPLVELHDGVPFHGIGKPQMLDTYGIIKSLRLIMGASHLTTLTPCYTISEPALLACDESQQPSRQNRAGFVLSSEDVMIKNAELVWNHIDKSGDCWLWMGRRRKDGYGLLSRRTNGKRKEYRATRVIWELFYGTIPDGMIICHRCDNPPCCNPDHLFLGTQLTNARDMLQKGRHYLQNYPKKTEIVKKKVFRYAGENSPNSKVSDAERREISYLYKSGALSQAKLAERYGISRTAVRNAIKKY